MPSLPKIGRKTLLPLLSTLVLFLSVITGVFLFQKQQELRASAQTTASQCRNPGHYLLVFVGASQSRFDIIRGNPNFHGVQVRYTWRDLEPTKGNYDFSQIESDLAYLASMSKQLVIQIHDREFRCTSSALNCANVPKYIVSDPEYAGGVVRGKDGTGWYPKIWNSNLVVSFNAMTAALGARFNGHPNLEAINLEESAFPYVCAASLYDYNPDRYLEGLKSETSALAVAFPETAVIRYMNHFPCRPNYESLNDLANTSISVGAGLGGPDTKIDQVGLTEGAYRIVQERNDETYIGYAVQSADYEWTNPRTGKIQTAEEILKFARDELGVNYLFWLNREPYWSNEVLQAVASNLTLNNCAGSSFPTPSSPTTPLPVLPGDINKDGVVNILDFQILSNNYGSIDSDSDLNDDGIVNILDFQILSNNFGGNGG